MTTLQHAHVDLAHPPLKLADFPRRPMEDVAQYSHPEESDELHGQTLPTGRQAGNQAIGQRLSLPVYDNASHETRAI